MIHYYCVFFWLYEWMQYKKRLLNFLGVYLFFKWNTPIHSKHKKFYPCIISVHRGSWALRIYSGTLLAALASSFQFAETTRQEYTNFKKIDKYSDQTREEINLGDSFEHWHQNMCDEANLCIGLGHLVSVHVVGDRQALSLLTIRLHEILLEQKVHPRRWNLKWPDFIWYITAFYKNHFQLKK